MEEEQQVSRKFQAAPEKNEKPGSPHSLKVVTALDTLATLAVEHLGYTLHLPAYHPVIIGTVVGSTYFLIKYKEEVTDAILSIPGTIDGVKKMLRDN